MIKTTQKHDHSQKVLMPPRISVFASNRSLWQQVPGINLAQPMG